MMSRLSLITIILSILCFVSCSDKQKETDTKKDSDDKKSTETTESAKPAGAIYVATNKADGNTVVGFNQATDGKLEKIGEYPTDGKGTGDLEVPALKKDETHPLADGVDPLISAYGIFKTQDSKHILVVNAGDGTISAMTVAEDHSLKTSSTAKAGDKFPISIGSYGDLVYVASIGTEENRGAGSGNLTGYKIDESGKLSAIENSTRELKARPSCVSFTTDGKYLIVSELATGKIKVFGVGEDGNLSENPVSEASSPAGEESRWLPIPVGFDVTKGADGDVVVVSEARFLDKKGMLREEKDKVPQSPKYSWQTGSASSYLVDKKGQIKLVSGDVKTGEKDEDGQIANCWIEIANDGKTFWAANALSSSLSSYTIASNGEITLKNETAFKVKEQDMFFSDIFLSKDSAYLNQLIGNQGKLIVLKIGENGDLTKVAEHDGMPKVGAYGLVSL